MVEAGEGAIVVTGNTSALRGKPRFAGFAPTKAVIDLEWTRAMSAKPEGDPFFIQPFAIADEIWHVVHQGRSAWSFNVEVRPFQETW